MHTSEVADTARWWAVRPLVMQPIDGRVRLISPAVPRRITVGADIAQLLLRAQSGICASHGGASFEWSDERYATVIATLAKYGYLVDDPTATEVATPWRDWGPLAWAYHASTVRPTALDTAEALDAAEEAADRPSPFRDFGTAPVYLLPRLSPRTTKGFIQVIEERRTHRHFTGSGISIDEFADVLRYTFGPLRFADAGDLGVMQLRAAASGGARHETEAFVYVFDVGDIAPGLYAYDTLRHGLVPIRLGSLRAELNNLTFEQTRAGDAAFGVITVAMSQRMAWKYRNPSAYRVLWQNVGCVAQVFSLMCASLDLGAAMTGAIEVEAARSALGLTSPDELITFAMSCGRPAVHDNGMPLSVRVPNAPFHG